MAEQDKMAQKFHILVVDDDTRICDLVARYLQAQGFVVMTAHDTAQADALMQSFLFDALVVDVMMPVQDGVSWLTALRHAGVSTPAILLTALGEAQDRIAGLEAGADDYIAKPFEPQELVLRLHAILRRVARTEPQDKTVYIGAWHFDPTHDWLTDQGGQTLKLTGVEANLLRVMAKATGEIVTRETLALACNLDPDGRAIDVQVTRLRRKIEEDTKMPRYLRTVRGKGYILYTEADYGA